MKISLRTAILVGLVAAAPSFAAPVQGAPAHAAAQKAAHHEAHEAQNFANARAFVAPTLSPVSAHETDGLSRNGEECSRGGCIDN